MISELPYLSLEPFVSNFPVQVSAFFLKNRQQHPLVWFLRSVKTKFNNNKFVNTTHALVTLLREKTIPYLNISLENIPPFLYDQKWKRML